KDVLVLVMLRGAAMSGTGLALGLAMAVAGGRLMSSLLYGVGPGDPVSYLAALAVLGSVLVLSPLIPALRAAMADPAAILRIQ
ncbi:MAG: hypothetical protein ABIG68_03960, partial [Acidobacteriota bacterium]